MYLSEKHEGVSLKRISNPSKLQRSFQSLCILPWAFLMAYLHKNPWYLLNDRADYRSASIHQYNLLKSVSLKSPSAYWWDSLSQRFARLFFLHFSDVSINASQWITLLPLESEDLHQMLLKHLMTKFSQDIKRPENRKIKEVVLILEETLSFIETIFGCHNETMSKDELGEIHYQFKQIVGRLMGLPGAQDAMIGRHFHEYWSRYFQPVRHSAFIVEHAETVTPLWVSISLT
tara:strand:- start:65742 stop:66437 length:696 start_codon:yes stop_codon:yes gene_type:complete